MATERTCGACTLHPAPLGYLCDGCAADLRGQLSRLPANYAELQTRLGKGTGGRPLDAVGAGSSSDPGCPLNLTVSEALDTTRRVLAALLALVPSAHRPRFRVGVQGASRVILANFAEVVLRPEVGQATADLYWADQRIERLLSPAAERVRIGTCPCGRARFAARTEGLHRCRDCGAVVAVSELLATREAMAEADFADECLTAHQASEATGGRVSRTRIANWIARGKIEGYGDPDGPRLVRFGDVLELEQRARSRRDGRAAA